MPQNGVNFSTEEHPKVTFPQGTATTAGTQDCPSSTSKDWEKIVDDIIAWLDTIEEQFQEIEMIQEGVYSFELETLSAAINPASNADSFPMISWNRVHRATQEDSTMTRLIDIIQSGMPDTSYELDPDLREYHQHRHDLHVMD